MKVTTDVEVHKLASDQVLLFHTEIGTAGDGERQFTMTRSMSGRHLGFTERIGEETVTYTVDLEPVFSAVLDAIVKGH